MSSNAKYTAAPQRDSYDDTAHYSQAPPSYAEPSSSHDQAALLGGGARNSEDNIPDDFKFGGSVAEASIDIRMAFVRKVYAILTVQLLATAILSSISFFSPGYKTWIRDHQWAMWVSVCFNHYADLLYNTNMSLVVRSYWFHAPHLLEAQVVSHEPSLPGWFHRFRSLLRFRHCLILRIAHCSPSRSPHRGHLRRLDLVRLPDKIRLYIMDAIPLWRTVGIDSLWFRGHVLPR